MNALTAKQRELLRYIRIHQENSGVTPSFEGMKEALALKSKSGVHRMIAALEERGFIRRIPNRARCIEIIAEPHLPAPTLSQFPAKVLAQEAKRRGFVLGRIFRDAQGKRRFEEIAA